MSLGAISTNLNGGSTDTPQPNNNNNINSAGIGTGINASSIAIDLLRRELQIVTSQLHDSTADNDRLRSEIQRLNEVMEETRWGRRMCECCQLHVGTEHEVLFHKVIQQVLRDVEEEEKGRGRGSDSAADHRQQHGSASSFVLPQRLVRPASISPPRRHSPPSEFLMYGRSDRVAELLSQRTPLGDMKPRTYRPYSPLRNNGVGVAGGEDRDHQEETILISGKEYTPAQLKQLQTLMSVPGGEEGDERLNGYATFNYPYSSVDQQQQQQREKEKEDWYDNTHHHPRHHSQHNTAEGDNGTPYYSASAGRVVHRSNDNDGVASPACTCSSASSFAYVPPRTFLPAVFVQEYGEVLDIVDKYARLYHRTTASSREGDVEGCPVHGERMNNSKGHDDVARQQQLQQQSSRTAAGLPRGRLAVFSSRDYSGKEDDEEGNVRTARDNNNNNLYSNDRDKRRGGEGYDDDDDVLPSVSTYYHKYLQQNATVMEPERRGKLRQQQYRGENAAAAAAGSSTATASSLNRPSVNNNNNNNIGATEMNNNGLVSMAALARIELLAEKNDELERAASRYEEKVEVLERKMQEFRNENLKLREAMATLAASLANPNTSSTLTPSHQQQHADPSHYRYYSNPDDNKQDYPPTDDPYHLLQLQQQQQPRPMQLKLQRDQEVAPPHQPSARAFVSNEAKGRNEDRDVFEREKRQEEGGRGKDHREVVPAARPDNTILAAVEKGSERAESSVASSKPVLNDAHRKQDADESGTDKKKTEDRDKTTNAEDEAPTTTPGSNILVPPGIAQRYVDAKKGRAKVQMGWREAITASDHVYVEEQENYPQGSTAAGVSGEEEGSQEGVPAKLFYPSVPSRK